MQSWVPTPGLLNQICMFNEIPSDVYAQNGLRSTFLHNMEVGRNPSGKRQQVFQECSSFSHDLDPPWLESKLERRRWKEEDRHTE